MAETTDIAPVERQENHPVGIIQQAVASGSSPEQLAKLMELQERWEANEARKAYHVAMSAFKANPPKISKDRHVSFTLKTGGRADYNHATLGNVVGKVNAALSEHGMNASWKTSMEDNQVTVTCRITHVQGHHEETTLSSTPDSSGGKNSIQAIGSAVTYLQRYTLLSLCGLATYDQDDDGAGTEAITEAQASTIYDYINECGVNLEKFLAWIGAASVEEIRAGDFDKAVRALKEKVGK